MTTKLSAYGYINAKLRARLSKILTESDLTALLRADSAAEVVNLLDGTDYRDAAQVFVDTGNIRQAEAALFETEAGFFSDIAQRVSGPPGDFVTALMSRYEVETLKRALRLWYEKRIKQRDVADEADYLYAGFPRLRVYDIIEAESLGEIAGLLVQTPYASLIAEVAQRDISQYGLFPVETALDKYYFSRLTESMNNLSKTDRDIAGKLIGVEIDLENLERIVRFKDLYGFSNEEFSNYLIPFGSLLKSTDAQGASSEIIKTFISKRYAALAPLLDSVEREKYSNLLLLEAVLHEVLSLEVKRALLGYPFSVGIILAYLFLKRREVRQVVLILNAKAYGLNEERVRDLL